MSLITALFAPATVLFTALQFSAAAKPNIVVILSDDMGFSDIGCYGGEIRTPHLDALAARGLRFTQFYNGARCCPTRASLLTGLYPHQAGVGHMTDDRGLEGYRGILNDRCVTIGEALRPAGYRTYMCGKWHVTRNAGPQSDNSSWPVQRGFEKFYGTITGAGSFYDPTTLCRQNTFITPVNDPEYEPSEFYYTDAISDNAVRFLQQHAADSPEKPFFLYLAYTAAHWPMHALERHIAKYKGVYDSGYESIRMARLGKMKQIGLVPADAVLSPPAQRWSDVEDKAWEIRCMEVYAAMVDCMDQGIGRVLTQLRVTGKLEDTLILYLQDNGGCAETLGRTARNDPTDGLSPMNTDELQPQIWPPMQTRDGRRVRTGPGVLPGPPDTYISYGKGWANVSNTPFREFKHWTHEGGISTPLIVHWPAAVPPDRAGGLVREPGQLVDIMATCLDAAGAAYPAEFRGHSVKPLQGCSLLPLVRAAEGSAPPRPLFWEHEGNRAVRDGKWKLVAMENKPWELYDIDSDRSELHDISATNSERVRAMAAEWDSWAARSDVLPLGGWRSKDAAQGKNAGFSSERRFTLKAGDRLKRDEAPAIAGKAFSITATFDTTHGGAGVIVAQGGTANGYALFMEGDRLNFVVRCKSEIAPAISEKLTRGPHAAVAKLDSKGVLTLVVDAIPAASSSAASLIQGMPVEGLQVGSDEGGAVGAYKTPNKFTGSIDSMVIELE